MKLTAAWSLENYYSGSRLTTCCGRQHVRNKVFMSKKNHHSRPRSAGRPDARHKHCSCILSPPAVVHDQGVSPSSSWKLKVMLSLVADTVLRETIHDHCYPSSKLSQIDISGSLNKLVRDEDTVKNKANRRVGDRANHQSVICSGPRLVSRVLARRSDVCR